MTTGLLDFRAPPIEGDITRRKFLTGAAAALLFVACDRDNEAVQDGRRPARGGFPLEVQHKYGGTEIPELPRRWSRWA